MADKPPTRRNPRLLLVPAKSLSGTVGKDGVDMEVNMADDGGRTEVAAEVVSAELIATGARPGRIVPGTTPSTNRNNKPCTNECSRQAAHA